MREKQLKSGICKEVRQVSICDEGGLAIQLCIWGEFANKFDLGADEHPVIAIKRATVSDWGGKSLNSNEDSQIIVNPPHPRTKVLQEWYKYLPDPSSIGSVTQNARNDMNL